MHCVGGKNSLRENGRGEEGRLGEEGRREWETGGIIETHSCMCMGGYILYETYETMV